MRKLFAIGALTVFAAMAPAEAKPITFTFESSNFSGEQVFEVQKKWCEGVTAASNGRFAIELLPLDAAVQASGLLRATGNGIIQGAIATTAHYAGEDPGFGLIGDTISAWSSDEDILKFYYEADGMKVVDGVLKDWGVKLVGVSVTGSESFVSKKPLRTIDDFKGVKLRAPSGPVTKLFASFGATPVNLPGSEVYTSLDKGVIDAADFSNFANNQKQGVNDIAKFPIYPGFHSSPTVHMIMNLKTWQQLSPEDQKFFVSYAKELSLESLLSAHYQDRLAVREAVKKGVTPVSWKEDDLLKVRQHAQVIWKEIADNSEIGKVYYDALIKYLQSQGQM
ncbi:TRAP dicarboxylate transporter-DctP subunit [uncultured Alphaproteobacteria bacterium]|uniref:TRAP dicarboxylate transporter-DctP subunit n=1 Tax=uncultured Alphaproteobacteria bacterium TaxID=91750 RepID=A0A212KLD9_9PROT|nr:TRAP dicarboxylate transporter-DctP subunit [uncultured Alphaproteobacteria bacterium]